MIHIKDYELKIYQIPVLILVQIMEVLDLLIFITNHLIKTKIRKSIVEIANTSTLATD